MIRRGVWPGVGCGPRAFRVGLRPISWPRWRSALLRLGHQLVLQPIAKRFTYPERGAVTKGSIELRGERIEKLKPQGDLFAPAVSFNY